MSLQDYEDWMRRVYSDYSFTILIDTPESFAGSAGYPVIVNNSETGLEYLSLDDQADKYLKVNSAEDAIEFVSFALTFLGLTDTPGDYTGHAGQYTKVKADESGLEFVFAPGVPSGTKMLFKQNSAPSGWTFVSEDNDRVILNTSTQSEGGNTGGGWTITGCSVNDHALSANEIPSHRHRLRSNSNGEAERCSGFGHYLSEGGVTGPNIGFTLSVSWYDTDSAGRQLVENTGGGGSHNHGFSSNGSWRPAYSKVITCQKD